MPAIKMNFEGDGCWPDLKDRKVIHLGNDGPPLDIAYLDGGMHSGKPSLALRIDIDDETSVVFETSLKIFLAAARAFAAKAGLSA